MNQPLNRQSTLSLRSFFNFLTIIMIALTSYPVVAEDYGRYRAIVMNEQGRIGQTQGSFPKVFIMDSKDGHMWTWEQKKKIEGFNKGFTLGTVLTYQGRVKPGAKMGEIITKVLRE